MSSGGLALKHPGRVGQVGLIMAHKFNGILALLLANLSQKELAG